MIEPLYREQSWRSPRPDPIRVCYSKPAIIYCDATENQAVKTIQRTYLISAIGVLTGCFGVMPAHSSSDRPSSTPLSLTFIVKSTGEVNGRFPAALNWQNGNITGEITTIGDFCVVNKGSTDFHHILNLSCTVENGVSADTYEGTLNILTGKGKGKFTDSYYNETGTYKVIPTKKRNQTPSIAPTTHPAP